MMSSSSVVPPKAAVTPSPALSDTPLASSATSAARSPPEFVAAVPPPPTKSAVITVAPTSNDAVLLEKESAATSPQEDAMPAPSRTMDASKFSSDVTAADTCGKVDTTTANIAPSHPELLHAENSTTNNVLPPSLQQRSRRSTANYQQDYSSEGVFTTEEGGEVEEEEEDSSYLTNNLSTTLSAATLTEQNNDTMIVLSMKDPNYKSIMFSYFQKLGATPKHLRDKKEEELVEKEVVALLKKLGGGRFVKYINFRSPHLGVVEVDEKTARTRIHSDIFRRLESKAHWATEEENVAPPIILSLKDESYRKIMFTAFQKLGDQPSNSRDFDEESGVKEETYTLLKSMGRKLMKYRDYQRDKFELVELDEEAAREKISNDINRRLGTKEKWSGVDLASELQEKDAAEEEEEEEETILGSDEGEDDEDGSDYEDDSRSSLPLQASGNDAILTMQNANYKAIMYSFFRQVGAFTACEGDQDEEKRVRNEAFNFFKGLGGRMMKLRNHRKPKAGLVEVDEETARKTINNDFCKRNHSLTHWAKEGASDPHQEGASKRQSAKKKVSAKKKTNKGASMSRPGGGKLVSIRKSTTKSSRNSPYPQRSKARVTFKDDLQYSVQKTPVAKSRANDEVLDAESSLAHAVTTTKSRSARGYTCGVCGQPKKGHKCRGDPSTSTAALAVQTPERAQSESQTSQSARSPKFITPTPAPVAARGRRKRQKQKRQNCGECENCLRDDCGDCENCRDKVKFGGRGTKHQRCEKKRCLANELPLAQSKDLANELPLAQSTSSTRTRSSTKRKSAVAANLTIKNVMADEDLENKGPSGEWSMGSDDSLADSQILFKKAKFASIEDQMPSFEEVSASEFNDLIDLLQSSPLPQRKVDAEMDWQGLYLADLSPIPLPSTRLMKLDTTKPIVVGPNSAWSQLIMTDEVATTPSSRMLKPRTSKSNPFAAEMEPKTSDPLKFESIMSPPSFSNDDEYAPIFSSSDSESEGSKLLPYSPIKVPHQESSAV